MSKFGMLGGGSQAGFFCYSDAHAENNQECLKLGTCKKNGLSATTNSLKVSYFVHIMVAGQ